MADLILSDDFKRTLDARIKSPEGQKALDDFAGSIVEWAIDIMSPDLREVLLTPDGIPELMKLWPEIVDGYFRAISGPAPSQKRPRPKKGDKHVRTTARLMTETQRLVALRREW